MYRENIDINMGNKTQDEMRNLSKNYDKSSNPELENRIFPMNCNLLDPEIVNRIMSNISNDNAITIENVFRTKNTHVITVKWSDGTVTCSNPVGGDEFDPYIGFCIAFTKKFFNKGEVRDILSGTEINPKESFGEPKKSKKELAKAKEKRRKEYEARRKANEAAREAARKARIEREKVNAEDTNV